MHTKTIKTRIALSFALSFKLQPPTCSERGRPTRASSCAGRHSERGGGSSCVKGCSLSLSFEPPPPLSRERARAPDATAAQERLLFFFFEPQDSVLPALGECGGAFYYYMTAENISRAYESNISPVCCGRRLKFGSIETTAGTSAGETFSRAGYYCSECLMRSTRRPPVTGRTE